MSRCIVPTILVLPHNCPRPAFVHSAMITLRVFGAAWLCSWTTIFARKNNWTSSLRLQMRDGETYDDLPHLRRPVFVQKVIVRWLRVWLFRCPMHAYTTTIALFSATPPTCWGDLWLSILLLRDLHKDSQQVTKMSDPLYGRFLTQNVWARNGRNSYFWAKLWNGSLQNRFQVHVTWIVISKYSDRNYTASSDWVGSTLVDVYCNAFLLWNTLLRNYLRLYLLAVWIERKNTKVGWHTQMNHNFGLQHVLTTCSSWLGFFSDDWTWSAQ